MSSNKFILDDKGQPIPEPDLMKWARWFENISARRVAKTDIRDDCWVSTVFLSIDHQFRDGPPILWETMVFGGAYDQEMTRCSGNREQAEAMHAAMVEKVKAKIPV